jgi:hypothetical protein
MLKVIRRMGVDMVGLVGWVVRWEGVVFVDDGRAEGVVRKMMVLGDGNWSWDRGERVFSIVLEWMVMLPRRAFLLRGDGEEGTADGPINSIMLWNHGGFDASSFVRRCLGSCTNKPRLRWGRGVRGYWIVYDGMMSLTLAWSMHMPPF